MDEHRRVMGLYLVARTPVAVVSGGFGAITYKRRKRRDALGT
jgi:hypothetical protein